MEQRLRAPGSAARVGRAAGARHPQHLGVSQEPTVQPGSTPTTTHSWSWPILTMWDPRFSWTRRQPVTHTWSLSGLRWNCTTAHAQRKRVAPPAKRLLPRSSLVFGRNNTSAYRKRFGTDRDDFTSSTQRKRLVPSVPPWSSSQMDQTPKVPSSCAHRPAGTCSCRLTPRRWRTNSCGGKRRNPEREKRGPPAGGLAGAHFHVTEAFDASSIRSCSLTPHPRAAEASPRPP